jgi:hypothetical protein
LIQYTPTYDTIATSAFSVAIYIKLLPGVSSLSLSLSLPLSAARSRTRRTAKTGRQTAGTASHHRIYKKQYYTSILFSTTRKRSKTKKDAIGEKTKTKKKCH